MQGDRLKGKKILIVDDEPDVLQTLKDLLFMCEIVTASSFEEGRNELESQPFDIAILDIMGVEGYKLLEVANKKQVIAVMLTARAVTIPHTIRSFNKGAASFVPKEQMSEIAIHLDDLLEAKEQGHHPWAHWLKRFDSYYEKRFGPNWKEQDEEFWKKFKYYI